MLNSDQRITRNMSTGSLPILGAEATLEEYKNLLTEKEATNKQILQTKNNYLKKARKGFKTFQKMVKNLSKTKPNQNLSDAIKDYEESINKEVKLHDTAIAKCVSNKELAVEQLKALSGYMETLELLKPADRNEMKTFIKKLEKQEKDFSKKSEKFDKQITAFTKKETEFLTELTNKNNALLNAGSITSVNLKANPVPSLVDFSKVDAPKVATVPSQGNNSLFADLNSIDPNGNTSIKLKPLQVLRGFANAVTKIKKIFSINPKTENIVEQVAKEVQNVRQSVKFHVEKFEKDLLDENVVDKEQLFADLETNLEKGGEAFQKFLDQFYATKNSINSSSVNELPDELKDFESKIKKFFDLKLQTLTTFKTEQEMSIKSLKEGDVQYYLADDFEKIELCFEKITKLQQSFVTSNRDEIKNIELALTDPTVTVEDIKGIAEWRVGKFTDLTQDQYIQSVQELWGKVNSNYVNILKTYEERSKEAMEAEAMILNYFQQSNSKEVNDITRDMDAISQLISAQLNNTQVGYQSAQGPSFNCNLRTFKPSQAAETSSEPNFNIQKLGDQASKADRRRASISSIDSANSVEIRIVNMEEETKPVTSLQKAAAKCSKQVSNQDTTNQDTKNMDALIASGKNIKFESTKL